MRKQGTGEDLNRTEQNSKLINGINSSFLNLRSSVSLPLAWVNLSFVLSMDCQRTLSVITSIIQTSHQTCGDIKRFDSKQNLIVPAVTLSEYRVQKTVMYHNVTHSNVLQEECVWFWESTECIWFSPKQTITSFPAAAVNLRVFSCFPEAFEATMRRTIVFCEEREPSWVYQKHIPYTHTDTLVLTHKHTHYYTFSLSHKHKHAHTFSFSHTNTFAHLSLWGHTLTQHNL